MGSYLPGDVILVSASIGNQSDRKVRPAVVVVAGDDGEISVCAVSSKPSSDAICIPLSINDFASGGLDLFSESYVLASRVITIRSGEVIGKRGRLVPESLSAILSTAPVSRQTGKKSRR